MAAALGPENGMHRRQFLRRTGATAVRVSAGGAPRPPPDMRSICDQFAVIAEPPWVGCRPFEALSACLPCLNRLLDEEDSRLLVPVIGALSCLSGAPVQVSLPTHGTTSCLGPAR